MKPYTLDIDINRPRATVIEIFDNPDNLAKWQPGFHSFAHLSGTPGTVGAKSKIIYHFGKRTMELIETITARNLPDEFNGEYQMNGGSNTMLNRFIELSPAKTRWQSTTHFTFNRPLMKFMGFFCAGMFRKQTLTYLTNFKALCESGTDVRTKAPAKS